MTRPDLHTHSVCSDGVLTPRQLVEEAASAGVTVLALTDHDTMEGCDALRGQETPIPVIPGVELSIGDMRSLHLLGYGYGDAPALRQTIRDLAGKRVERARRMLDKLERLGMPLDWRALEKRCHGTIGRPHIARAMVHAGYVACMQDAFARYIGHDQPAYVPGERLNMHDALALMRESGFVPVLAHPCELPVEEHQLPSLLEKWKDEGLMGVEVYHPSAASRGYTALDRMTRRMGLLVTGGSDFHQENDRHGRLGCTLDQWRSVAEDMQALQHALEAR